ncbi:MAG: hypothetical protein H7146_14555, partial [Burkholderiaceae bacterium]|nr:hypothetical protein [Microbacteriaceae bacterium]
MSELPRLLLVGPDRHGVAIYARQLAAAVGRLDAAAPAPLPVDPLAPEAAAFTLRGTRGAPLPGSPVHLHATDRILGATPELAADWVEYLAGTAPVTVTLHDLPQPSDGVRNLPRRAESYRRIAGASSGVVFNSAHERALFAEYIGEEPPGSTVIPLPVVVPVAAPRQGRLALATTLRDIAVLGFLYPGKGHAEVLGAILELRAGPSQVRSDLGLLALGAVSPGSEHELTALRARAEASDIRFMVTGFLADAELERRARLAAVPVAAHRHVSASGSIGSWISAGRRPLVAASRYVDEMARLRPGTMTVYPEGGLAEAIRVALADPASTWLA